MEFVQLPFTVDVDFFQKNPGSFPDLHPIVLVSKPNQVLSIAGAAQKT